MIVLETIPYLFLTTTLYIPWSANVKSAFENPSVTQLAIQEREKEWAIKGFEGWGNEHVGNSAMRRFFEKLLARSLGLRLFETLLMFVQGDPGMFGRSFLSITYAADRGQVRMVCYCWYQANAGRHRPQNCHKLAPIHTLAQYEGCPHYLRTNAITQHWLH